MVFFRSLYSFIPNDKINEDSLKEVNILQMVEDYLNHYGFEGRVTDVEGSAEGVMCVVDGELQTFSQGWLFRMLRWKNNQEGE